jgi:aspartate/methionine/tyrosine aminotransferase
MTASVFSRDARSLAPSVTHGTKAMIDALNTGLPPEDRVVDLSIGTLDTLADPRIDRAVAAFLERDPATAHAFAPVKGFPSLRAAIAARSERLHGMTFDPASEIIVTPGGIKGALAVTFHTFLDPGDEVVIPVPNWPHYADMVKLHGGVPRLVVAHNPWGGLVPCALRAALSPRTKLVILGDCINPTGKVYSNAELALFAQVIAEHPTVQVVFDCPYEAHVFGDRAKTFAALPGMRHRTISVTGPGKTYGMHGDRVGYALAAAPTIAMMERVQVNLNSFACTYGMVATEAALHADMDVVATRRALAGRANLEQMVKQLSAIPGLRVQHPAGGYFLWVDFSTYAAWFDGRSVDDFLLREARVAVIGGGHFAEGVERYAHFARINCGRSLALLDKAVARIEAALHQRMARAS